MEKDTAEKEKKVVIPEKAWKEVQETLEQLKASNDLLLKVADKKQLSLYYQKNQKQMPYEVNLRAMNVDEMVEDPETKEKKATGRRIQKVIVGWVTTKNEVYKNPNGVWVEDQRLKVLYEDGTAQEMTLAQFNSTSIGFHYVKCTRTGIVEDEQSGSRIFKLTRQDNGRTYEVGEAFVN